MMNIKVFGKLSDIVTSEIEAPFPMTVSEFRLWLKEQFPTLQTMDFGIAVNHNLVNDGSFMMQANDTIALLPPFSGG